MSHAHRHHGADTVVKAEMPHARAEMNITPLIDILAGVDRVGIITEGMRKAAATAR